MRAVLAFLALCALVQARQTPSLDPSSDTTSTSNLKNSFAPYIDTAKRTAEEQAPACPDATALGLQLTQARQELLNKQNYITRVQNQNTELSQTVASLTSQLQAVKEPAAQFEITRRVHEAQITQYKEMSVVQTASLARLVKQVSRQNAELVALRRRDEHNSAALVTKSRQLDLALKQVAELGEKLVAANNRLQQLTVLYGDANNKLQKLNATREDQRLALQTAEHNHRDALFAYDQATEQNKNFRTVINLVQTQLNDTQTKLQQCQTEKEALQNQLTPKVSAKDFMNSLTQPNPNLNVRVN